MRFLVTGANGFVGQYLCAELLRQGQTVRAAVRSANSSVDKSEVAVIGAIDGETNWADALRGVDVVIHLAARVHVMKDSAADPLAEFLKVNMQGTVNLAHQAAAAGVRRLVYVSSIKVNGERTSETQPFSESDIPNPQDAYAISKWRAEEALHRVARETGLEVVILRPPLVYGPGVKGNFSRLLAAVDKGIPMPLASVHNKRSMIYLGNLVSALIACASHPAAAGKTYLVRDGEDVSLPELIRQIAAGLGKPPRLFHVPVMLLRGSGRLVGKSDSTGRLLDSLRINDDMVRGELGWKAGFTLQQGLQATADWYKARRKLPGVTFLKGRSGAARANCTISVVIVNYNAGEVLRECVASAQRQADQIIVVDNASVDNSIAALRSAFPAIEVICMERNLGFAAACNVGAQVADCGHILFLNPDCILEANAISILLAAVHSSDDVGMVGGLLTDTDGTEQCGGRRAVPTPWRSFVKAFGLSALSNRYPRLFSDFVLHKQPLPKHPVEVEAISGACMLARRDALENVGLLDEGYFMHCEDLDWCMRFRQKGWKILFVPDARMVHYKGHCSRSRPIFVEWNKHKGMIRFYRKFFRHQYPGLLMGFVIVGVWLRFVTIAAYCLLVRLLNRTGFRRG
jgi:nucleoside-diphosphate-sugar epimerase/GT2 family glycosyltransferase